MSSDGEREGEGSALIEPEGVNAGGPVDRGASPGDESGSARAARGASGRARAEGPEKDEEGQGEMLSRAGSENGLTRPGPGQETSAEEG